jgi:hypothetical protein
MRSDDQSFFLNETQEQALRHIGQTKRVVVIFIKWKYHVLTNLEILHKPNDAALIGFFAEQMRAKLPHGVEKNFNEIFWFNVRIWELPHNRGATHMKIFFWK